MECHYSDKFQIFFQGDKSGLLLVSILHCSPCLNYSLHLKCQLFWIVTKNPPIRSFGVSGGWRLVFVVFYFSQWLKAMLTQERFVFCSMSERSKLKQCRHLPGKSIFGRRQWELTMFDHQQHLRWVF